MAFPELNIWIMNSQWLTTSKPGDVCNLQWAGPSMARIMARHLLCTKPLPEPMLITSQSYLVSSTDADFPGNGHRQSSFKQRRWNWGTHRELDPKHTLQWRHNEHADVSNNRHFHCFTQPFVQAQIKENIKAPSHWPLWEKFTCDRWIPRTKGQ